MSDTNNGMTGTDQVQASIREFIEGRFPIVRERALTDEDSLLESGAVDSLGILDVVTYLEETFGITVADEELSPEYFDSVTALAELVKTKKA